MSHAKQSGAPSDEHADNLWDEVATADYLGLQPNTLAVWRATRRYPLPYVKIGSRVRYRKSDLDEFIRSHTVGAEDAA